MRQMEPNRIAIQNCLFSVWRHNRRIYCAGLCFICNRLSIFLWHGLCECHSVTHRQTKIAGMDWFERMLRCDAITPSSTYIWVTVNTSCCPNNLLICPTSQTGLAPTLVRCTLVVRAPSPGVYICLEWERIIITKRIGVRFANELTAIDIFCGLEPSNGTIAAILLLVARTNLKLFFTSIP